MQIAESKSRAISSTPSLRDESHFFLKETSKNRGIASTYQDERGDQIARIAQYVISMINI
jgi:hypothetical protein